jgi:hypothetical protein
MPEASGQDQLLTKSDFSSMHQASENSMVLRSCLSKQHAFGSVVSSSMSLQASTHFTS